MTARIVWLLLVALAVGSGVTVVQPANAAPPPPAANVRVVAEFDFNFSPNVWNGFSLGPTSNDATYLVEVSPLTLPQGDGAFFSSTVQREFSQAAATWNDVARIQLLGSATSVLATVRIYAVVPK